MYNGTLIVEFDGEVIHFNIFDAMTYPSDLNSCFLADIIDSLAQQINSCFLVDIIDSLAQQIFELTSEIRNHH